MQYFFVFFRQFSNILCPYMYVLKKKPQNTIVAKTRTSNKFHFGFIIQIKYEKRCLKNMPSPFRPNMFVK